MPRLTTELKQDLGALAACGLLVLINVSIGVFMALLVAAMMVQNKLDGVYDARDQSRREQRDRRE